MTGISRRVRRRHRPEHIGNTRQHRQTLHPVASDQRIACRHPQASAQRSANLLARRRPARLRDRGRGWHQVDPVCGAGERIGGQRHPATAGAERRTPIHRSTGAPERGQRLDIGRIRHDRRHAGRGTGEDPGAARRARPDRAAPPAPPGRWPARRRGNRGPRDRCRESTRCRRAGRADRSSPRHAPPAAPRRRQAGPGFAPRAGTPAAASRRERAGRASAPARRRHAHWHHRRRTS